LFVYICIVVADSIIKKAEDCDPILQYTALYMNQIKKKIHGGSGKEKEPRRIR
jgi:hypothetical protein